MSTKKLEQILKRQPQRLYIALSGGIDSLTLMTLACEVRQEPAIAVHAISAAVPSQATDRCRELVDATTARAACLMRCACS